MVREGLVNSDLNTLASTFSNYNSIINDLSNSWKGDSYQNLIKRAQQFSEEYYSGIKKQMDAFASACNLYAKYEVAKSNKEIADKNYNTALSKGDTSRANEYKSQSSSFSDKMASYKKEIESYLLTASSIKLDAVNYYGSEAVPAPTKPTTPKTTPKTSPKTSPKTNAPYTPPSTYPISDNVSGVIKKAIAWGIAVANDNTHGYSQKTRWGNPNYDCASLVISCYKAAGLPVKENGAGYCGNMKYGFTRSGFIWIKGQPSLANLKAGDVLLDEDRHTEMYIGNGMNLGAHNDYDHKNGDSSGREISVTKYSNGPWDGVLRYVGKK